VHTEDLYTDTSNIPGTGKGLFTSKPIKKDSLIIEYTGDITTWDDVKDDASNMYIYYVNENYVINAKNRPHELARYANDAHGLQKVKGLENNSVFVNIDDRIYIKASKDIPARCEILVDYGTSYWETIRENSKKE
jgi:SET domain-containing protein